MSYSFALKRKWPNEKSDQIKIIKIIIRESNILCGSFFKPTYTDKTLYLNFIKALIIKKVQAEVYI